jgi:hypothetical protein
VCPVENDLQVKFGNYMPHNSYMLYVTEADARRIRSHSAVLWLGGFLPQYKVWLLFVSFVCFSVVGNALVVVMVVCRLRRCCTATT